MHKLTALSCFFKARDVYEEAILTVVTVRDFTQVFDSYAQFEESMIAAKMETTSELGQDKEGERSFLRRPCSKYSLMLVLQKSWFPHSRGHWLGVAIGSFWVADN